MKNQEPVPDPRSERLSLEIYRELGKNGWRLPETKAEVQAAEVWVEKSLDRLPARLNDLPDKGHGQSHGRMLDRYLGADRSADDSKAMDTERSSRDLERD
jgi:hypothetical protein